MGIEENFLRLKNDVIEIGNVVCQNRDRLERIEAMLKDLLADNKPKDRLDKEKAIKDTMPCVERQVDTL